MEDYTVYVAGQEIEIPRHFNSDLSRCGGVFMQTAYEKDSDHPYSEDLAFTDFVVEYGIELRAENGDEQAGLILNTVPVADTLEYDYYSSLPEDEYGLEVEQHKKTPNDPRKIIAPLGSAVAGFSVTEVVTHSELLGAGSALLSAGLIGGFRQAKRLRTRHEAQDKLESIQSSLDNPEKRIRLPHKAQPQVLSAESYLELRNQSVQIGDIYGTTVSAGSVLDWVSRKLETGTVRITSKKDALFKSLLEQSNLSYPTPTPGLEIEGIVVLPETTIWQCFETGSDRYRSSLFSSSSEIVDRIASYKESAPMFAAQFDLEMTHQPFTISRLGLRGDGEEHELLMKEYGPAWEDSKFAVLHLPAGLILPQLLEIDKDPSELFSKVIYQINDLAGNDAQIKSIQESISDIIAAEKLSGESTPQQTAQLHELQSSIEKLQKDSLVKTMSILAVAMTRNKAHQYDAIREELLGSISATADSDLQRQAINLFDTAIMALIINLQPDSDQAVDTGVRLKDYLTRASELLDSADRYNQLYNGMRNKFPELQLPNLS